MELCGDSPTELHKDGSQPYTHNINNSPKAKHFSELRLQRLYRSLPQSKQLPSRFFFVNVCWQLVTKLLSHYRHLQDDAGWFYISPVYPFTQSSIFQYSFLSSFSLRLLKLASVFRLGRELIYLLRERK